MGSESKTQKFITICTPFGTIAKSFMSEKTTTKSSFSERGRRRRKKVTEYFGAFRSPERRWLHSKMFAGGPIKSSESAARIALGRTNGDKEREQWGGRQCSVPLLLKIMLSFNLFFYAKNVLLCSFMLSITQIFPKILSLFFCTWKSFKTKTLYTALYQHCLLNSGGAVEESPNKIAFLSKHSIRQILKSFIR